MKMSEIELIKMLEQHHKKQKIKEKRKTANQKKASLATAFALIFISISVILIASQTWIIGYWFVAIGLLLLGYAAYLDPNIITFY